MMLSRRAQAANEAHLQKGPETVLIDKGMFDSAIHTPTLQRMALMPCGKTRTGKLCKLPCSPMQRLVWLLRSGAWQEATDIFGDVEDLLGQYEAAKGERAAALDADIDDDIVPEDLDDAVAEAAMRDNQVLRRSKTRGDEHIGGAGHCASMHLSGGCTGD